MRELIPVVVGFILLACGLYLFDLDAGKAIAFVLAALTAPAGFEMYTAMRPDGKR